MCTWNIISPLVHIVEIVYFSLFFQSFLGISVCMPELCPHESCVSQQVQEPCKANCKLNRSQKVGAFLLPDTIKWSGRELSSWKFIGGSSSITVPVPVKEVNIHLYCSVNESSLQENGFCFLGLPTEQSHSSISSFLSWYLLDVINVLHFVCLWIKQVKDFVKKVKKTSSIHSYNNI